MTNDKRIGQDARPENLKELLTSAQLMTLDKMETCGWRLFFVRRPLFQDVVAVIKWPDETDYVTALIEDDGRITRKHDIVIRQQNAF